MKCHTASNWPSAREITKHIENVAVGSIAFTREDEVRRRRARSPNNTRTPQSGPFFSTRTREIGFLAFKKQEFLSSVVS